MPIKKIITAFAVFAVTLTSAVAEVFKADTSHSSIEFNIQHLVISEVTGKFKDFEVEATFNPENRKLSAIKAVIQTDSINTENEKRDQHLKSPDFFNTAKQPSIMFTSTKVNRRKNRYTIQGDLTIKGITKPVTLKGKLLGYIKDAQFGARAGFSGKTKINRKDFNLTWNKVMESGGLVVGDEVEISIRLEMVAQ